MEENKDKIRIEHNSDKIRIELDTDGKEHLIFNIHEIEEGVLYDFIWDNEMWGLKKEGKSVQLYAFQESLLSRLYNIVKRIMKIK